MTAEPAIPKECAERRNTAWVPRAYTRREASETRRIILINSPLHAEAGMTYEYADAIRHGVRTENHHVYLEYMLHLDPMVCLN